jgi:ABC-type sugar transport system substrate-binding protein
MKKLLAMVCTGMLALGMMTGAAMADTGDTEGVQASPEFYEKADLSILEGKKIGITIQSLENAYWAGVMTALQEQLDELGANTTIVACDDSSATQIGQVENFISSGCDLIMIHPSDAAAVEDVAKEAQDAEVRKLQPFIATKISLIISKLSDGKHAFSGPLLQLFDKYLPQ